MPRMPKPQCECDPHGHGASTSENIKLKVLEDRLKAELAPRDLSVLKELLDLHDGDYVYVYDTTEIDVTKRLKRILMSKVRSIIVHDIEKEVSDFALRYELVSQLPVIGEHNVIYLVPVDEPSPEVDQDGKNNFNEYIWVDNSHGYERFGSASIDLSAYRKAADQDVIDADLRQRIANVITRLEKEITDREADVDAEEVRATAAEGVLQGNIDEEERQRKAEDIAIKGRLTDLEGRDYVYHREIADNTITDDATKVLSAKQGKILRDDLTAEFNRADTEERRIVGLVEAEESRASGEEQRIEGRIDALDMELVGQDGSYIKTVRQEDGQVTATKKNFDTDFNNPSHANAPTSRLVKETIDEEQARAEEAEDALNERINDLDLETVGSNGGYIKTVGQVNGQVSATRQGFDTAFGANPTDDNAPTSKLVKDTIDAEVSRATDAEQALDNAKANKATTLSGYGIDNAYTKTEVDGLLNDKADKATTLAGYGITDAYTKDDIDRKLSATFEYKGSKELYTQLPFSGNKKGDVWNVQTAYDGPWNPSDPSSEDIHIEAGDNVAWDGNKWDRLGGQLVVDTQIDDTSTNPVENRVIAAALLDATKVGTGQSAWGATTVSVGGIPAGTNIANREIMDILHDILYPYVAISNPSISISPSNGTYLEKGDTVTLNSLSCSVSQGSEPTANITLALYSGSTKLAEGTGLSLSYNFDAGTTYGEGDMPTFKMTATDTHPTALERSLVVGGYTWLFKSFHGVVASSVTTPTEADVEDLTGELLTKSTRSFSYNMTGQKAVYAYPASYGNLAAIYDANNFLVTNSFDVSTLSITNSFGETTNYKVYISKDAVTANMTYRFQFQEIEYGNNI